MQLMFLYKQLTLYKKSLVNSIYRRAETALNKQKSLLQGFITEWRRVWDSNPRAAFDDKTISSRSRYDHFDNSPCINDR